MADYIDDLNIRRMAFVGGFLPRPVTGAMPATLLCSAFASEFCDCESQWLAISDVMGKYAYPSRVRFEVLQSSPESYRSAAEYLNLNAVDIVCFIHDFDLFTQEQEENLTFQQLFQSLRAPVVTSIRDLPFDPKHPARQSIALLAQLSTCLIVSSPGEAAALRQAYAVPDGKIRVIEPPETDRIPGPDEPEWRVLARQYMDCFRQARQESIRKAIQESEHPLGAAHPAGAAHPIGTASIPVTGAPVSGTADPGSAVPAAYPDGVIFGSHDHSLPVLKLDHFLRMTDETGILKGAVLSLPDYRQGYCTSDNARALMFSLMLEYVGEGPFIPIEMQMSRHLAFLLSAFNAQLGRFRETMDYTRAWQDEAGSEECHGLAVWALGMTLARSRNAGMQGVALELFEAALPAVKQFSSLRAWAFSLLGIHEYLRRYPGDRAARRTGKMLLDRLVQMHRATASEDWPWFEEALGAGSVCVSQALIASSQWNGDPEVVALGVKTLGWLAEIQFQENRFVPVGDQGYYRSGGQRARFAQRPIEARGMISACLDAYRVTDEDRWLKYARGAFQWFLGRNDLGQPLYDPETGGCCSGLLPGRLDRNAGAESLLSFLLAQLDLRLFDQLYRQRKAASPRLPILQIGSPSPLIHSEDGHFSGLD